MNMLDYCIKKASGVSKTQQYRLYACVTDKRGKILGEGQNEYLRSHPVQAKYAKILKRDSAIYLHAECNAIVRALKNGTPHAIWIARVKKNNQPGHAQPCEICSLLIKETNIKEVHYTV